MLSRGDRRGGAVAEMQKAAAWRHRLHRHDEVTPFDKAQQHQRDAADHRADVAMLFRRQKLGQLTRVALNDLSAGQRVPQMRRHGRHDLDDQQPIGGPTTGEQRA